MKFTIYIILGFLFFTSSVFSNPITKKTPLRITKDNVYVYGSKKQKASFKSLNYSLHGGLFNPKKLSIGGTHFSSLYQTSKISPLVFFDIQFFSKPSIVGRLGVELNLGIYANVHGRAIASSGEVSQNETTSFFAFPVTVSLTYRLQFWNDQILFPFVKVGGGAFLFYEKDTSPNHGYSFTGYAGGGVGLNLSRLAQGSFDLSSEYGINNFFLIVSVKKFFQIDDTHPDFSSTDNLAESFISGGITLDY